MKKTTLFCFLILISSFTAVSSVQAASITFNPSSQSVDLGDMLTADIVISGLHDSPVDEIVSAFDLDISFNQNVLAVEDPIFGSFFGDPLFGDVFLSSDIISTPGTINLAMLSLLSDIELAALQSDSFVLATLAFTAIESGTSVLDFVPHPQFGIDIKGLNGAILDNLVSETENINVIGRPTQIPEPPVVLLIGMSLFILYLKSTGNFFQFNIFEKSRPPLV